MGLSFYTLGQRQGLGIGGIKQKGTQRGAGDHAPWFVARKDAATNTLYAVQGHDHPWLLSNTLTASDLSWCAGQPPGTAQPASGFAAKTRYRQTDAPCTPTLLKRDSLKIDFLQPQWAITPGQSLVLYQREICLGGGVIN